MSLPEWEYVPEGWARAGEAGGWNVAAVADEQLRKWDDFVLAVQPPGTLGIQYEGAELDVSDYGAHNTILSFAYVLALAARGRERLSMLDWGGGLGHYCMLARALLPGLELEYVCKDVSTLAAAGRTVLPDADFVDDDSILERRFDLVLVSGSLQYAEDWRGLLRRLGRAAARFLYVTRLPVTLTTPSFVVLQRAHAHGYGTEYLGWVLNRNDVLAEASGAGLELAREFLVAAWFDAEGAPERPTGHRGFLFRPLTEP